MKLQMYSTPIEQQNIQHISSHGNLFKTKQTTPNKRLEKNKLVFVLTSRYQCRKLGCDSVENVCVKYELLKTAGVCCKDMAVIKNDHRLNLMFNRPFNIMSKIAIKPRL